MSLFLFSSFLLLFEVAVYFSHDMYLVIIPQITESFFLTEQQVKLTFILWSVGSACLQLFLGPISQIYGRRSLLLFSNILFIVSSYLCAITDSFLLFCTARLLQGTAVGSIFVAGYTTIHSQIEGTRAILVLSVMNAVTLIAPAFGPLVGAITLSYFGTWSSLFYILAIAGSLSYFGLFLTAPRNKVEPLVSIKEDLSTYKKIVLDRDFAIKSFLSCSCFCIMFLWVIQGPFVVLNHFLKDPFYYAYCQVIVFATYILSSFLAPCFLRSMDLNVLMRLIFLLVATLSFILSLSGALEFSLVFQVMVIASISLIIGFINAFLQRQVMECCQNYPLSHKMALFSTYISISSVLAGLLTIFFPDSDFSALGATFLVLSIFCLVLLMRYQQDFRLSQAKIV